MLFQLYHVILFRWLDKDSLAVLILISYFNKTKAIHSLCDLHKATLSAITKQLFLTMIISQHLPLKKR